MKCKNCKSSDLQVEMIRENIYIYKDVYKSGSIHKAVNHLDFNKTTIGNTVHVVYCNNCSSVFEYLFKDELGREIEHVGIKITYK